MKKQPIVVPAFLVLTVLVALQSCDPQNNTIATEEKELADFAKLKSSDYSKFYIKMESLVKTLNADQALSFSVFNEKIKEGNEGARLKNMAECECPNQSKCEATCSYGHCCICWSPPKSGTCGCVMGMPACKAEDSAGGGEYRLALSDDYVVIYPNQLVKMFDYLESIKVNTVEARSSFTALLPLAVE